MDRALSLIILEHKALISLPFLDNGGTTILVHSKLEIVDSRSFLKGQVGWVIVIWQGCCFGVMNLYAPHSKKRRKDLWLQIQTRVQKYRLDTH